MAVNLMARKADSRRTMRVISRTKLESNVLGSSLLTRIIAEDDREGSPLRYLTLFLWRASVADFVDKYERCRGTKDALTLKAAKDLASRKPSRTHHEMNETTSEAWKCFPSNHEVGLTQLIFAGKKNEEDAFRMLATSKELFRGLRRQIEAIQDFKM